jgi:hypothetical protein
MMAFGGVTTAEVTELQADEAAAAALEPAPNALPPASTTTTITAAAANSSSNNNGRGGGGGEEDEDEDESAPGLLLGVIFWIWTKLLYLQRSLTLDADTMLRTLRSEEIEMETVLIHESTPSTKPHVSAPPPLGPITVSWHACHNFDPPVRDQHSHWDAISAGAPRPTDDVGIFTRLPARAGVSGTLWKEVDPDNTLEEEWERVDDGGGRFLAVQGPGALLVVAGSWFAYARDANADADSVTVATDDRHISVYAAGRIDAAAWTVHMSTNVALEGCRLTLPHDAAEWVCLPGSTLPWPPESPSLIQP